MKVIGTTDGAYLAQITEDEIAILLGFRSTYDDGYKTWKARATRSHSNSTLAVGTEVQVREISQFWTSLLWREEEATKAAETLRALASLISTNLPRGIVPPEPPPVIVEVQGET